MKSDEADVLKASTELLEAEEQVERLTKELEAARVRLKWARVNHRAAAYLMRCARQENL